eukprot:CAMPEP_0184978332 /NCGR_PEP_ID=MMETSP1098-20130426/8859_1 /TAXON_ID=89044 /ORGANISM="Spumella elongata, Strain CCAP 955/1" /LENGTH=229 /DNA_ID=CAMNT_0027501453 /DNA_START=20 /DNA_END=709 /DNA_ORIENTATION=-
MALQSPKPDSVSHTAATTPHKTTTTTTNVNALRPRSDSEIARELQAEWDAEEARMNNSNNLDFDMDAQAFNDNSGQVRRKPSGSMDVQTDNATLYGNNNYNDNTDLYLDDVPALVPADYPYTNSEFNSKLPASSSSSANMNTGSTHNNTADSFTMYHFNGLEHAGRTATLTAFRLTRRSAVDSVGQAVAFQGGEHSSFGSFMCPIEEVLRTRWPGCNVDWKGQTPPSID